MTDFIGNDDIRYEICKYLPNVDIFKLHQAYNLYIPNSVSKLMAGMCDGNFKLCTFTIDRESCVACNKKLCKYCSTVCTICRNYFCSYDENNNTNYDCGGENRYERSRCDPCISFYNKKYEK